MRRTKLRLTIILVLLVTLVSFGHAANADVDAARSLARRSIQAMGGEQRLAGLHSVSLKGIGHRYMLEQSERPEGPWLLDYFQISEERDLDASRIRRETTSRGCDSTECWKSAGWDTSTLIVADHVAAVLNHGKVSSARVGAVQPAEESFVLSPDRALLLALQASDLHTSPDTSFHGFLHHAISFAWHRASMKILLSVNTNFTRTRPYEVYWSPWGDVTTRVTFAFWMLEPGGLHYPRVFSYETNGQPDWVLMINELKINPPIQDEDFRNPR
jgi:hypothetical protein